MCKLKDLLSSCQHHHLLFPFISAWGQHWGCSFLNLLLSPELCDSYPVVGTGVSFSAIYRLMIGFTLPKCKEKKGWFQLFVIGCILYSSLWPFLGQLCLIHDAFAIWLLRENFRNHPNISICVRQGVERRCCFAWVVTFSHLMPKREMGGCPMPGNVPG